MIKRILVLLLLLLSVSYVYADEVKQEPTISTSATVNEEYADRIMKVQVVSRSWIKNVKLLLSSVENADSLRGYFPEDTFEELKSQMESGVQLAKKGVLGTVFSYVTQPLIVQIKVIALNDLDDEDEEDEEDDEE